MANASSDEATVLVDKGMDMLVRQQNHQRPRKECQEKTHQLRVVLERLKVLLDLIDGVLVRPNHVVRITVGHVGG